MHNQDSPSPLFYPLAFNSAYVFLIFFYLVSNVNTIYMYIQYVYNTTLYKSGKWELMVFFVDLKGNVFCQWPSHLCPKSVITELFSQNQFNVFNSTLVRAISKFL